MPPTQTLSHSRGEKSKTLIVSQPWRIVPDFYPRLRDKVWVGGLGTRLVEIRDTCIWFDEVCSTDKKEHVHVHISDSLG